MPAAIIPSRSSPAFQPKGAVTPLVDVDRVCLGGYAVLGGHRDCNGVLAGRQVTGWPGVIATVAPELLGVAATVACVTVGHANFV